MVEVESSEPIGARIDSTPTSASETMTESNFKLLDATESFAKEVEHLTPKVPTGVANQLGAKLTVSTCPAVKVRERVQELGTGVRTTNETLKVSV